MTDVPDLPTIIEAAISRRLTGVHVAVLATFVSYSEANQTATVRLNAVLDGQDVPPLADVPVLLPGAWSSGDPCLVIFCEEEFAPDFSHLPGSRHDLSGAVCIPIWATAGQVAQFVALANLVKARLDSIQTWLDAHVHPTALGPSGASVPPLGPLADVAATKVKAR